jgi:hypothetical protein
MKQAIVYCEKCGHMVPPSDIASGRLVISGDMTYCRACGESVREHAAAGHGSERSGSSRGRVTPRPSRRAQSAPNGGTPGPRVTKAVIACTAGGILVGFLAVYLIAGGDEGANVSDGRPATALPVKPPALVAVPVVASRAGSSSPRTTSTPSPSSTPSPASARLAEIRKMVTPGLERYDEIVGALGYFPADYEGTPEVAEAAALLADVKKRRVALAEEERKQAAREAAALLGRSGGDASALVAWWKLDESSGTTVRDSSPHEYHAELKGSPGWNPAGGRFGGALTFPGDGASRVSVDAPRNPTLDDLQRGDYTLCAWVRIYKAPSESSYGVLTKVGWNAGLFYTTSGTYSMGHFLDGNKSVKVSSAPVAPGAFHHVAGVVDRSAGTVSLYVDGALSGKAEFSAGTAGRDYGSTPWRIGIVNPHKKSAWGVLNGAIDDVQLWARALTAREISGLANVSR